MDRRLDIVTSKEAETITRVDSNAIGHRLHILPLTRLRIFDLQTGNDLTEKQGDCRTVGMSACIKTVV